MFFLIRLTLLAFVTGSSAASAGERLETPDDSHPSAVLTAWNDQQILSFRTAGDATTDVPVAEIIRYGRGPAPRSGQGLVLVDGSLLMARVLRVSRDECEISGRYGSIIIPRPLVRAVLVHALPVAGYQEGFVRQALEATGGDDHLLRVDGDLANGTLRASEDGIIFQRGTLDVVRLTVAGQIRSEPLERLRGIIFSPLLTPPVNTSRQGVLVGMADGSRLWTQSLQGNAEVGWRLRLVCGLEIALRPARFSLDEIRCISSGTLAEDSDAQRLNRRAPLRVRTVPLVGQPTVNEPAVGGPTASNGMRIAAGRDAASVSLPVWREGQWYAEAIEMPVGSQAVYRGSNQPRRFRAAVGLADGEFPGDAIGRGSADAPGGSAVRFRIRAVTEGGILEIWNSEPVASGWPLEFVDVVIPAAAGIILDVERLTVDSAGHTGMWIAPVLSRP